MDKQELKNNTEIKKILNLFDNDLAVINTHFLIVKKFGEAIKKDKGWFKSLHHYFIFAFTAHLHSVIIGIRKFFDRDDRSYSLYSILEYIEDGQKSLKCCKEVCNLKVNFELYEKFGNKIIAHFDKDKKITSATILTLDFLDENKLPKVISELIHFVKELQLYFGEKQYLVPEYINVVSEFDEIIRCLKQSLNNRDKRF